MTNDVHDGCISLQSHQVCENTPTGPTFFTALVLLECLIFAHLECIKLHFIVVLICIFPVVNELTRFILFIGHAYFLI